MSEAESNLKQEHRGIQNSQKGYRKGPSQGLWEWLHSSSLTGTPGMLLYPCHNKAPGELGWNVPPHSCYPRVRKLSPQLSAPGPQHICWLTGEKNVPFVLALNSGTASAAGKISKYMASFCACLSSTSPPSPCCFPSQAPCKPLTGKVPANADRRELPTFQVLLWVRGKGEVSHALWAWICYVYCI